MEIYFKRNLIRYENADIDLNLPRNIFVVFSLPKIFVFNNQCRSIIALKIVFFFTKPFAEMRLIILL